MCVCVYVVCVFVCVCVCVGVWCVCVCVWCVCVLRHGIKIIWIYVVQNGDNGKELDFLTH